MIYGIGTDLVEISRIESALGRFGERFARRILSGAELDDFRTNRLPAAFLAKRFAAKEAFGKALGTGLRGTAAWHAIRVERQALGKPELAFSEPLSQDLRARGIGRTHLTLTDERMLAGATVILECGA